MTRLITYYFTLILLLGSCTKFKLKYPYAENNTTIDTLYDVEIEDDYKWLEIAHEGNKKWFKWQNEQKRLTDTYISDRNLFLRDRIIELNDIPLYIPIEIINNRVYYFKINANTNHTDLYSFNLTNRETIFIKDLGKSLRSLSRLKGSLSMDESKFAIINTINDYQNNLLIYDLQTGSDACDTIFNVRAYKPLWFESKVHYINDAFNSNDFSNQVCSYDVQTKAKSIHYESDLESIFDPLDISIDRINGRLYITDNLNNKCNTFKVDLIRQSEPVLINSMHIPEGNIYRMAGTDEENIFYIKHDKYFISKIDAYHIDSKKWNHLYTDNKRQLSEFNQIKDHVILSYKNMKDNKAVLINTKNLSSKPIRVIKEGVFTFVNNRQDTTLVFSEQSFTKPKSLNSASIRNSDYRYTIIENAALPFNPDDFVSKHVTIKSETGRNTNIVISHKKDIKLNGENPAIVFFYPNSTPIHINTFHFSRIMYMEQGFVFVQRSYEEYAQSFSIEEKEKDMRSILTYLTEAQYTDRDKLCISGYEYGASVAAKAINNDPTICKAVIMTNGIFDFVLHPSSDKIRYHNKQLFDFQTKEELQKLLIKSPYHNIKRSGDYPAILALYGDDNKTISPSHTYKYIAKLQMRTKGNNPICMHPHLRMNLGDSNVIMYDYKDHIYHALNFLSEAVDINLSSKNISRRN